MSTSAAEPGAEFLGVDDSFPKVAADCEVSGIASAVELVERWNRLVERRQKNVPQGTTIPACKIKLDGRLLAHIDQSFDL